MVDARLSSHKRLRLRLRLLNGLRHRLVPGGVREIRGLDKGLRLGLLLDVCGWGWDGNGSFGNLGRSRATVANVLLGPVAVVSNILFHQSGGMRSALFRQALQLVGLRVDQLLSVLDLGIDELTVVHVNKRS